MSNQNLPTLSECPVNDVGNGTMSFFKSHREKTPERPITLEELFKTISTDPELKEKTDAVRQAMKNSGGNKRDQRVVTAKGELPAVTVSGTITERTGAKDFRPSGYLQVDIDGVDPAKRIEIEAGIGTDPSIHCVFVSPSGTGLKAIAKVELPEPGEDLNDWHSRAFDAVKAHIKTNHGLDIDPATRNPSALMYLAYDERALRIPREIIPIPVKKTVEEDCKAVSEAFGAWLAGFKGDLRTLDAEGMAREANLFVKWLSDEKIAVRCPWEKEHTTGSTGSDTALLLKKTDKGNTVAFKCLHANCAEKKTKDFLNYIGQEIVDRHCKELYQPQDKVSATGLPALLLPCENNSLSTFADEMGKILRNAGVYVRGGIAFIIQDGECVPVDPSTMRTWVEQHLTTHVWRKDGDNKIRAALTMSADTARAAFMAPQFLGQLRPLKFVMPAQVPFLRKSGEIELLPRGYDEESGINILEDSPEIPTNMELSEAIKFLNYELLVEFPFVQDDGRSRSVAIAAMLTVFAGGLLDPYAPKPTFIYTANSEGSGKTLLAMLAGIPYGIVTVTSPPPNETEWNKTILSFVISGRRLIVFDNVKGFLASPSLEGYLTSIQYEGRILGQSKIFRGDAGAVVAITGNGLTVSPDIRRRSLFVELFTEELRPEDRVFKKVLDQSEMLRLQPTILGALYALVRSWDENGRPEGTVNHSSFPRWGKVIGGIMENAGYINPCSAPQNQTMGDTDPGDMQKLAEKMTPEKKYEFKDIAELCIVVGLFERATSECDGNELTTKGKSILGRILTRFDRKIVTPTSRFVCDGRGHTRRYFLEAV